MKKIGKFEIIEQIGKGGMGVVYKARDPLIDREVAIKVILERALEIPEAKERFYREARSAGKLSHENITIVHEVGEFDGNPYIVMEYLKGTELSKIISDKQPVDLKQKISYAIQVCKGLQFAHSHKIIHRDIKPENILILEDGRVKIMDFGIAKPESSNLTQTGMMVGTISYMSPEQIKGLKVDKRADIFSFGVLLYELLTYNRPFLGDSTTVMYKIVNEEPDRIVLPEKGQVDELQLIISRCLSKKAEDRYPDCFNIIQDLKRIVESEGENPEVRKLLTEGRVLWAQQKFSEALKRFDKVLKIDPAHEEAKFLKEQCLESEDQIQTIVAAVDKSKSKTISHYRIIEQLGSGGMGIVYKAEDMKLKRTVALKVLPPNLTQDKEAKQRLVQEAQAASALDHPNICTIYEIDETPDKLMFISMAHCEGETLTETISKSKLKISESLDIATQIARGLAKAHEKGIVHRDIKPSNIIVTCDDVVKIVDFGIAKLLGSTKLTKTGTTLGTASYMSPEQAQSGNVDHRTDIWSLGVILYEMLTGEIPFQGDYELAVLYSIVNEEATPISQINPEISTELQQIVNKALKKDINERYSSMGEMLNDLQQVQHPQAIQQPKAKAPAAKPPEVSHEVSAPVSQKRSMAKIFTPIALAIVAIAVAGWLYYGRNKNSNVAEPIKTGQTELIASGSDVKDKVVSSEKKTEGNELSNVATTSKTSVDLSALKDSATSAKNKTERARKNAGGAKESKFYKSAVSKFNLGQKEFDKENYGPAKAAFVSAEGLFSKAVREADEIKRARMSNTILLDQAEDAQQDASDAKKNADNSNAKNHAKEAYRYATGKDVEGQSFFSKKNYSKAIPAFQDASTGYKRTVEETKALQRAGTEFQKGDYENALRELEPVFSNAPYSGKNEKANKLNEDVKRGQRSRDSNIAAAKKAAEAGNIMGAISVLKMLPDRDQTYFEISNLKKKIITLDKTAPVIDHTPEKSYRATEPLPISARVQDNLNVSLVQLHYNRKGTKQFTTGAMKFQSRGVYSFSIPLDYHKGKEVRYYITARDGNGNEDTDGTQKKPYKIKSKGKSVATPQIP